MTATIDPEQTLGALVAERPALTETLEQLRLDYCCGGQTLAEACRQRGLDPDTVAVMLERLAVTAASRHAAPHDLRGATIAELCDHIVTAHHDRLRSELPRIEELLATVVRVHGNDHGELHDLQRLFTTLARELVDHLATEERDVFPAARASGAASRSTPRSPSSSPSTPTPATRSPHYGSSRAATTPSGPIVARIGACSRRSTASSSTCISTCTRRTTSSSPECWRGRAGSRFSCPRRASDE